MSEVINMSVQLWKQKAKEGTLTPAEMKQAIAAIRAERVGSHATSAVSKEKKVTAAAKKAPIDGNALLQSFLL